MGNIIPQEELIERLSWLIRLRWIAVVGVNLVVLSVAQVFKFTLPIFPLYAIAIALAVYNLAFFFLLACLKNIPFITINKIANAQIGLDLFSLACLIHFSGGIENPFIFYFIFHMIIASILLSRRASFLQATFAVTLFCLIISLEYFSILPHYSLKSFMPYNQYHNLTYIFGVSFVFITTLYIAVYMATSITARLRQREELLAQANAVLQEKDRVKSEYVLRVSHNIKEHLAAIQGCLEPVAAGIIGELNAKQLDLVQRAAQRTIKLMFFVKALLKITRIKLKQEIKMEQFSFTDMLSEATAAVSLKAKDRNISLSCAVEPGIDKMRGAKEYLQETFTNILANAVKYTPHNGRIEINVNDKGSSILITIQDTGIGIPREELPRIFEEFYRASNAREVEGDGTGLGLAIVKQVVLRHKGRIWLESELGKGTQVSIELPK